MARKLFDIWLHTTAFPTAEVEATCNRAPPPPALAVCVCACSPTNSMEAEAAEGEVPAEVPRALFAHAGLERRSAAAARPARPV